LTRVIATDQASADRLLDREEIPAGGERIEGVRRFDAGLRQETVTGTAVGLCGVDQEGVADVHVAALPDRLHLATSP
jgi:hypothetical protein